MAKKCLNFGFNIGGEENLHQNFLLEKKMFKILWNALKTDKTRKADLCT